MSTLPVVMLGMRWAGSCRTNSTFFSSSNKPFARMRGHGDVHADELALLVLEVPGRVGAAGSDDQLAAVEHGAQQAAGRRLRRRFLGRTASPPRHLPEADRPNRSSGIRVDPFRLPSRISPGPVWSPPAASGGACPSASLYCATGCISRTRSPLANLSRPSTPRKPPHVRLRGKPNEKKPAFAGRAKSGRNSDEGAYLCLTSLLTKLFAKLRTVISLMAEVSRRRGLSEPRTVAYAGH